MTDTQHPTIERYVALGDSYTIGEGATQEQAWPSLLTTHLQQQGVKIELVANPSVTGWTTRDLIEQELPILEASSPTFATLLIGVNDWVQGASAEEFKKRLTHILDKIQATLPGRRKALLITIPDFSITPDGPKYSGGRDIPKGISAFNDIIKTEARLKELPVVDIFPLSQELKDARFISADNLHPSAAAYARWEQAIFPAVMALLQ